jgi:8-oxo-dGTP pyrophosphatase MutT (NUDIX family)
MIGPISLSDEELVYSNPFMEVRHTVADFSAFQKNYYVVHFGPRAGVVVVRNGSILLTRQYRFLPNALSWEIPGGKVEESESPETAAARECQEETSVIIRNLKKLTVYYPGLDNVQNRTTIFWTNDCDEGEFKADKSEIEEVHWISLDECMQMIKDEKILDSLTVTGVLAYRAEISSLR